MLMEPQSVLSASTEPPYFGTLWLANAGFLGFRSDEEDPIDVETDGERRLPNGGNHMSFKCDQCYFCATDQTILNDHVRFVHKQQKIFKCDVCEFTTTNSGNYTYHMSTHTGDKPHQCEFCDHRTRSASNLRTHIRVKHTGEKPYECPSCEYKTAHPNVLKTHIAAKHTGEKKYKCPECNFSALHSGNLRYHILAKHSETKPFKCTLCDYAACHKGNLKIHMDTKHSDDKKYKCPRCNYTTGHKGNFKVHIKVNHGGKREHKCPCCDFVSDHVGFLENHISTFHQDRYSHINHSRSEVHFDQDSTSQNSPDSQGGNAGSFVCYVCGYIARVESELELHVRSNHPIDFTLKCPTCNFFATDSSVLDAHKNNCSVARYPFKCSFCPLEFQFPELLKAHESMMHKNNENSASTQSYRCQNCSFIANSSHELNEHLKTNHQSKSYNYQAAPSELSSNSKHELSGPGAANHSAKGRKFQCVPKDSHKCSLCNTEFHSFEELRDHTDKIHPSVEHNVDTRLGPRGKYSCPNCSFIAQLESELQAHLKEHSPQYSFTNKCKSCDFVGSHLAALEAHVNNCHRAKNVLNCPQCPSSFEYPDQLSSHMSIKHHQGNPQATSTSQKDIVKVRHSSSDKGFGYKCGYCEFIALHAGMLEAHMNNCHKNDYPLKYFQNPVQSIFGHMKSQLPSKNSSCAGNLSLQEKDVEKHKKDKHSGDCSNGYKCSSCEFLSSHAGILKSHIDTCHPSACPLKCSICALEFFSSEQLCIHVTSKHNLKQHLGKQMNYRKSYKCSKCPYLTHSEGILKAHLKTNHSIDNLFGYKCSSCDFVALHSGILEAHIKNFHGAEYPLKCTLCPAEFFSSDHLKAHIADRHNQVKQYQCPVCVKIFSQLQSLNNHVRQKHNIEVPILT